MSISDSLKKMRPLAKDKKGAALAEFALALFPLLWMFFTLMQVGELFINHLVLHHAAVVAARCAVVYKQGTSAPNLPMAGDYTTTPADTECKNAAIAGVGKYFWFKSILGITVQMDFAGGTDHIAQYGDVTTTVKGQYKCAVPLGRTLVCGSSHSKTFDFVLKLPHEGAMYKVDSDYNGS
jgi:Flp pilus assembly protein TadG